MIWVKIDHIPTPEVKDTWELIEKGEEIGFEITEKEWNDILAEYIWVDISYISQNLRYLINQEDTFIDKGIVFAIIKQDLYDNIIFWDKCVEFSYIHLPSVYRNTFHWTSIRQGEKLTYISPETYRELVETYAWLNIAVIPQQHIHKGEIINENTFVIKKDRLPSIFRHLNCRG